MGQLAKLALLGVLSLGACSTYEIRVLPTTEIEVDAAALAETPPVAPKIIPLPPTALAAQR